MLFSVAKLEEQIQIERIKDWLLEPSAAILTNPDSQEEEKNKTGKERKLHIKVVINLSLSKTKSIYVVPGCLKLSNRNFNFAVAKSEEEDLFEHVEEWLLESF